MISVVMLTHNRPKLLRQALVTLYVYTPADAFRLVVVDDYSTEPEVTNILGKYISRGCVLVTPPTSSHVLAKAKNYGVQMSSELWGDPDYLLLCDNDVCFTPDWHKRMLHVINTQQVDVLGGQRHPYHQPIRYFSSWTETDAVAGTSQLMSWRTWQQFGPLEGDAPGVCQSEDFAFCQKIRMSGLHVGYMSDPAILDCGITQTNGELSPGAHVKPKVEGILYI